MTQLATRALAFASGDLSLEGVLHLPDVTPAPGVVVCHPHPQYGGDMDNNVVLAACRALASRGFVALRFNFRGAGGSDGAFDQGLGERDARAALGQLPGLPEVDAKRIGLVGYSFGAAVAAEVASGELRALALVSPPVAFSDLRVAWGCPAFVIAGDRDEFAPGDRLRVIAEAPGVELRIIPGADHFWWGFEAELGEALGADLHSEALAECWQYFCDQFQCVSNSKIAAVWQFCALPRGQLGLLDDTQRRTAQHRTVGKDLGDGRIELNKKFETVCLIHNTATQPHRCG